MFNIAVTPILVSQAGGIYPVILLVINRAYAVALLQKSLVNIVQTYSTCILGCSILIITSTELHATVSTH